nr:EOG090X0GHI [Ilyocryptus agilis]
MSNIIGKGRHTILDRLPAFYRNFFKEWKYGKQTPVHYRPEEGKWKRIPETGEVRRIQNRPLPLIYPEEFQLGLWGGEAVVKGFTKKKELVRRHPHYWVPALQKSVVHSEMLDQYMEVIVTPRTLRLIDQHHGFDNYILESSPQDLKSNMGIKLKRKLLLALATKEFLPNNPVKREELLEKYKKHILPLEDAEWYGLTLPEALEKLKQIEAAVTEVPKQPLKNKFREEFIQQLKEKQTTESSTKSSWTTMFNPFKTNKSV